MRKYNSLFSRLITSHTIVVLIAVLAIGFAADTFFRLFLVEQELSRLVDNVSAVARRVVVPGESGWVIRSERSILINTLQLAGIELYELPPSAAENLSFTPDEWNSLLRDQQLFRKTSATWFGLPELELYLIDGERNRLLLLKNPMGQSAETLSHMRRTLIYSGLIAILLGVLISYGTSRYTVTPIRNIQHVARKVVQGDFRQRVRMESYEELDDLAATFNQAVDRVEETMKEQQRLDQLSKQFVSNVSHEFRVPLTSLAGFLELLQEDKIPAKDKGKVTAIMQKDVERLSRLVHDLLDLSRLQSGKIELERELVPLKPTVEETLDRLSPQLENKPLSVTSDVKPSLVVWADEDRLQQILLNLIGNAVQHSPAGESVEIGARSVQGGQAVQITVVNRGTTIPPEELPYLWERFTKVDKSRSKQGTGLGLAITRELVHLHGGHIEADNLPDQSGVRVTFTLPAREN